MKGRTKIIPLRTPQEVVDAVNRYGHVEYTTIPEHFGYDDEQGWTLLGGIDNMTDERKLAFISSMSRKWGTLYREVVRYSKDEENAADQYEEKIRALEDRVTISAWAIIILLAMLIFLPVLLDAARVCALTE